MIFQEKRYDRELAEVELATRRRADRLRTPPRSKRLRRHIFGPTGEPSDFLAELRKRRAERERHE